MDERRHSLANPELCATYCHVPREKPLLERNLSEVDGGDCLTNKTDRPTESTTDVSPSQSPRESAALKYSVPTFTFTAVDCAPTYDGFSKRNNKHNLTIKLDTQNHTNPDMKSAGARDNSRDTLIPPDPSLGIGPCRTEFVDETGHSGNASKKAESSQHMEYLKTVTERLKLTTRRPSYIVWKKKYIDDASEGRQIAKPPTINSCTEKDSSAEWTQERKTAIDSALEWLRTSLLEMREQDHALARRLVELRQDIQQVKLQRSYEEHQDILEEAIDMIDGRDVLCDAPPDAFSPTLKQCGVTKMNLSTRRFSVF